MIKLFRVLPYILLICNLLFIFGNSLLDGQSSMAVSKKAEQAIEKVVGKDIENDAYEVAMYGKTFNNFLRKCAHAVEFFSLGVLSCICFLPLKGVLRSLSIISLGMAVPLIDETIQLFTGRSSKVSDIWIDITGYAVGCILTLIVFSVIYFIRKKRLKHE